MPSLSPVPCATPLPVKPPPPHFKDPCSFSEPTKIQTEHTHLDLHIDMNARTLSIRAIYIFKRLDPSQQQVVLDACALKIISVKHIAYDAQKSDLSYELKQNLALYGDALVIQIPKLLPSSSSFKIEIQLTTDGLGSSPAGGACDWLDPSLAASCPFVYTQCQSINARCIFPCQDTPAAKAPYSTRVTLDDKSVDQPLQVVMSAQRVSSLTREADLDLPDISSRQPALFECNIPVPSYLFAFAVGCLEARELSPRCAVWALPDVVDAAKWEFDQVEQFLQTAEKIAGPYVWGRYDLIVMPPSYPLGGMENPMLTFVTPTLLSGDRSLVNVVIHEICHSWAGNLVSCQDSTQFWMNEGFTVKLERRIIRELHGSGHEGIDAIKGRHTLDNYIKSVGKDHTNTTLVSKIKPGDDPDDYFSCVPYEKGYNFLLLLEQYVKEDYDVNIDQLLRDYFEAFKYQAVRTEDFEEMLRHRFPKTWERVNWAEWVDGTGPCPKLADIDTSLVEKAESIANSWVSEMAKLANEVADDAVEQALRTQFGKDGAEFQAWPSAQQVCFLSCLSARILNEDDDTGRTIWTKRVAKVMRDVYKLDKMKNCEIRFRWCRLVLASQLDESLDNVVNFISHQGRMKFVRPIFNDLHSVYPKNGYAVSLFNSVKDSYHGVTRKMIQRDLDMPPRRFL